MATYYVRKTGSDAAAGTSAGAAWQTIGKALGAAGIASGDTLYIGAGRYDESVTVAMTSAVATTSVIGDVTGQYTGDAGEVAWTAYTTDLDTQPTTTACLIFAGRDYLSFSNICFYGGRTAPGTVDGTTAMPTNITFTDCAFLGAGVKNSARLSLTVSADTNAAWLFDRCLFFGTSAAAITITLTTGAGADYDANIIFRNSVFQLYSTNGGTAINVAVSGTGVGHGGGVLVHNCTLLTSGGNGIATAATYVSTTYPVKVYNSYLVCGSGTILNAGTAGQIVEDYNTLCGATRSANVTNGAASHFEDGFYPIHVGQERIYGGQPRPWGTPAIVGGGISRLLGKGTDASVSLTTDGLNRPRPAGGQSTSKGWGALERHDTATKETSVTDAGGVGIKITGPGDQDIQIPVAAAATTITVRCRYDTNHGTGSKPQAILQTNGEIGVTTSTATAAAAVDTWETLTLGPFTPTAAGVVTVRLVSRAAAASGIAYFDSITVV